jgi:hypothetical protein
MSVDTGIFRLGSSTFRDECLTFWVCSPFYLLMLALSLDTGSWRSLLHLHLFVLLLFVVAFGFLRPRGDS